MHKLSIVLQAVIIVLLAIIIALIVYYGTNPPRTLKAPGSNPAITSLRPHSNAT